VIGKRGEKISARAFILEEIVKLDMRCGRPVSAPKLKTLNLQACGSGKHCLEIQVRQTISQHPDFHTMVYVRT
jgi:hypothetical protein